MAISTCIKCGHISFELKEVTPIGSAFRLYFIQCAGCGGVIGVMDLYNIGHLIHKLANELDVSLE